MSHRPSFPPYHLLDSDHVRAAQEKFDRLARLYHHGQQQSWDGRKVLGELLERHGGIHLPDDKRAAIAHVFSVILWGELAAWSISADLALLIDDHTEAKMAATSQAFDEARHFYVMRDYLLALGIELPPLDGYTSVVLNDLLETHRLADKLIGMQLIVENIALTLFRGVAQTGIEPVLCGLMPYYERDESRHVGLGALYLPHLLRDAGAVETLRLRLVQLKIITLIGWGTHAQQEHFLALGIHPHTAMRRAMKMQKDVFEGMRGPARDAPPAAVIVGSSFLEEFNERAISIFFPPPGTELPKWHRTLIDLCHRISVAGDQVLRRAA